MVKDGDVHDVAGFYQPFCHLDILPAGGGVAGRMVVQEDDSRRMVKNCCLKDLPWMDDGCRQAAYGDVLQPYDVVLGVQQENGKALLLLLPEMVSGVTRNILRAVNNLDFLAVLSCSLSACRSPGSPAAILRAEGRG